jgi:peptidyl-prolyl cis-trans isomerase D
MFEFIRTHQRLMQFFLLVLIVPSFVLVGVSSYKDMGGAAGEVANVAGQPITQGEWEAAQRDQMERFRGMAGAQFDPKMFETPAVKAGILENLVAERALNAEVARNHLTVPDAALQEALMGNDGLKKPDGSFDMEQYKAILSRQNLTPEMYDARVRKEMAMAQLNGAIESTAFAPRAVAKRLSDINEEEREVQELVFPVADFVAQVKVTDELVKAFYDKNANLFKVPEQAKIEYVVLDNAAVESLVTVADAEVSAYYNANMKRFATEEQRNASHILINVKKDASAADKAAAKAKAEAILAEVRKTPADFGKIAKAQSQDPASAELNGDLGLIEKGALPKAVEETIYKLKKGDISEVVSSEFGLHIITVTGIKPATQRTLDEVKAEVAGDIKKSKLSKKYSELAEVFTNTVYEQSDSLKAVADKLKLKIETAANLSRLPSPAAGTAVYNNAKFLKAVFSDESIKNKRNTEAVEVAPNTLIAGRIVEFKPEGKRPLAEVDALIRQRVTQDEAVKLARKAGEVKLAAAKASGDVAGFSDVKIVSRTKAPTINNAAAMDVLKADTAKLPAYVGVELPGQGYGVYRINKVGQPATPDVARRASEAQQISGAVGQQEMYAYVEALKKKAKAKISGNVAAATAAAEAKPDSAAK